jgi:hypothetical protein
LFLADPTDVPAGVVAYVAGQVGAGDASCLDGYMRRRATRFEHTAEIVAEYGYRDFASAENELAQWLGDLAWTTGDGATALFVGAVGWLRGAARVAAGSDDAAAHRGRHARRGHAAAVETSSTRC